MTVVVLAAGYGTRLYPLTLDTPKALLPVRDKPILAYLFEKVAALSLRELILVSNHRYADSFREWLSKAKLPFPWQVLDDGSTSEENRLGSVGDLAFAISTRKLREDLLVLGSDNLFSDSLGGFLDFSLKQVPAVTLGVYGLKELSQASRYGVLQVDEGGRVTRFSEKPSQPTSNLVSTAIYFFPASSLDLVLQYVPARPEALEAGRGFQEKADTLGAFIQWLMIRHPVFAYPIRGPWVDIGDIDSYQKAQGEPF